MATENIKFVGDSYFNAGTHTAANDIYIRSTAAADAGFLTVSGVLTSSGDLGRVYGALTASEGKIETKTGYDWDTVLLLSFSAARAGTTTVYDNNGTAASGTIHVHGLPADGDTLTIGLDGFTSGNVATFKTTLTPANDEILIQANVTDMASAIASWVMNSTIGGMVDDTDWVAAAAHPYVTATSSGADVTLTDRIACARQLSWTVSATLSDASDLSISAIRGGIDGTLLGTIEIGSTGLSATASSGIDMDSSTTDTLPPGFVGSSKAVHTRGKFSFHVLLGTDPAAAVASKIELSHDKELWRDAPTTAITDLDTDQDQEFSGSDLLFSEYMRYTITANSSAIPVEALMTVTTQS